jgi:hypothetical protein
MRGYLGTMTAKGALDSHEEELHWAAHWANATKTIAGYPFLKALLKDFADLRPSRRIENVFFYLCSYNNPELVGFEEFLGKFWTKLGPKDSRDLSRRASSNNGEESSSVLMEGLLARHFSSRISIENIKLHPLLSNGKHADLRVSFGRRIVYYEVSSLGTGKFDAQLKTVYGIVSKIVLDSLPSNFEVWIHVDPVKFPKNDLNQLDVNMAISQMNDCLDRLNLRMLWGPDGPLPIHLNLESLSHLPNDKESIYDHHQKRFGPFPFSMLNHYDKLLAKVIDKEPVRSWARMVTPSMIYHAECPSIRSYRFLPALPFNRREP